MPTTSPTRVVMCSAPPLLLPGSGGASGYDELGELRDHARRAVDWLCELSQPVLVLYAGTPRLIRDGTRLSARSFGLDYQVILGAGNPDDLTVTPNEPAALVAAHLLARHRASALAVSDPAHALADVAAMAPRALLVMGGGSARRRDGAPGYLDERAVPFDDTLARRIDTGDLAALAAPDLAMAHQLLADLPGPLAVAASQCIGAKVSAHLDHYDAPYGVANLVARWSCHE